MGLFDTTIRLIQNKRRTDLFDAINNGDMGRFNAILEEPMNLNDKNDMGWTALMIASSQNNIAMMDALIKKGGDIDAQNSASYTPLMIAMNNRHIEAIHKLIESGANVNMAAHAGWTPLMMAALGESLEIVTVLLSAGAQVADQNIDGKDALAYAKISKNQEVAILLQDAIDNPQKYGVSSKEKEQLQKQVSQMSPDEILKLSKENEELLKKMCVIRSVFELAFSKLSYEEKKIFYGQTYKTTPKETRVFMEQQLRDRIGRK